MSLLAPVLAAMFLQAAPPVQRPSATPAPAPVAPAPTPAPASVTPTPVTPAPPPEASPVPAPAASQPETPPTAPTLEPPPAVAPTAPVSPTLSPRPAEKPGPPFYSDADMQALRARYGLEPNPPTTERKPVFRCWVADPTCGFVVEVNATSSYAFRLRQGSVNMEGDVNKWSSARVQYDIWFSIPTVVETRGKHRYTRLSLGPKGGVIASDSKDIWGNVGLAGRYWFGRKRFAPNIEFTAALAFKVAGKNRRFDGQFDNVRGPIGITADIAFGLGGFGSIVVGGQFDSPLAREDVPEAERLVPAGMFFIGFRGNIAWGAPAAIAVGTHVLANRAVTAP